MRQQRQQHLQQRRAELLQQHMAHLGVSQEEPRPCVHVRVAAVLHKVCTCYKAMATALYCARTHNCRLCSSLVFAIHAFVQCCGCLRMWCSRLFFACPLFLLQWTSLVYYVPLVCVLPIMADVQAHPSADSRRWQTEAVIRYASTTCNILAITKPD